MRFVDSEVKNCSGEVSSPSMRKAGWTDSQTGKPHMHSGPYFRQIITCHARFHFNLMAKPLALSLERRQQKKKKKSEKVGRVWTRSTRPCAPALCEACLPRGVIGSTMGAYPRGTGSNPVEGYGHFFPSCRSALFFVFLWHTHTHTHTHTHRTVFYIGITASSLNHEISIWWWEASSHMSITQSWTPTWPVDFTQSRLCDDFVMVTTNLLIMACFISG